MEEFASAFVIQYLLPYWSSVYGLACAGGLVGWLSSGLSRANALGRVPYFVRLCLVTLFVCVVEIATVKGGDASVWGVATRLAALLMAAPLIGGFYVGRIAAARSRDAFGHPYGAMLAFIPLANLWLLFKSSRTRAAEPFGLTHGEEGAIFGLILLMLAGGAVWLEVVERTAMPDIDNMMQMIEVVGTKQQIRDDGLQKALEGKANVVKISSEYNGDYYYDAVKVEQDVITFTLKARWPGRVADLRVQRKRRSDVCGDLGNAEYLKAGAIFRTVFLNSDGLKEATTTTSARDCGSLPSIVPWWAWSVSDLSWPSALTLEGKTSNERALRFLILPDSRIWSVSLGLMMLGGLGAAAFRSKGTLGRAPYFLGNCVLVLVATVSWALLIPTTVLVTNGHMGFMAALWALVQVACGAVLWRLAARRSREVHGHAKAAALAFVPVANLWLLVAPPLGGKEPGAGAVRLVFSAGQIVSALAGLALLGGAYWAGDEIEQGISHGLLQDGVPADLWIRFAINKDGIEKVLKGVAGAGSPAPRPDEPFTQSGIRAVGLTLYETWISNRYDSRFSRRQMVQLTDYHCSVVDDMTLMNAGATLQHVYVARSGRRLGLVKVSKEVCGL